ncbi:MAG: hypothetical protein WAT20_15660 [Ferruginibacter sp.]|nr:hypothetical protein [Chitinophagaceae bacterium]
MRFKLDIVKLMILSPLISQTSCNDDKHARQVEPSFYYWKSVLNVSEFEKQKLDSLKVKTIYLKFFDVDWDEVTRKPLPVAKLQAARDELQGGITIIPTVFITNECIQKIDTSQVKQLAENMYSLILEIKKSIGIDAIPEIQIDCDWTEATKEKYFLLLKNFKLQTPDSRLSCTIRLHQIKFFSKTGVPPVDRGLLMCYNMGNLKNPATNNSILETQELKKYTGNLSRYPLPLDVAFPLFNWKVLYRNNMYSGLIQGLPDAVFSNSFCTRTGNRYRILKDTLLLGYDLRKDDLLRDEQSDIKEVLAAAREISRHLKNTPLRVSLYHLDSVILNKYSTHELESIYNSLH